MSSRVVYFLNGPNANLYGLDAKGVYGTESFPQIEARCRKHAEELRVGARFPANEPRGRADRLDTGSAGEGDGPHHQRGRADLYVDRPCSMR